MHNYLQAVGSKYADHLRVKQEGKTGKVYKVYAVFYKGDKEFEVELFSSKDASESIQWAIDHHVNISVTGVFNLKDSLRFTKNNQKLTGEKTNG